MTADKKYSPGLTVVMPAHNEDEEIASAITRIMTIPMLGVLKLVIVDDGSTDHTVAVVESLNLSNVTTISYSPNRGKGYALQLGTSLIQSEFGAYFDSDLDLHPSSLAAALAKLKANPELTMVVGSKIHPESNVEYPLSRRILSHLYRTTIRVFFNFDVSDTQTGMKVFRTANVVKIAEMCSSEGWTYDLELIARLSRLNLTIEEVPVDLSFQFSSKLGLKGALGALVDTYKVFRRIS